MKKLTLTAAMLLTPTVAFAHAGHGATSSLFAGLVHPLSGIDHLTVMLTVGALAACKGGRALWLWPAAFVGVMIAGAVLGMMRVPLPLVEPAILASVVVLGMLMALAVNLPTWLGVTLVGFAALFHGSAHGAEAEIYGGTGYMLGFIVTTAVLHLTGIGAVLALRSLSLQPLIRVAGAASALIGVGLTFHII
jgi:urease accessory protein